MRQLFGGIVLVTANLISVMSVLHFQAGAMRKTPRLHQSIERVRVGMLDREGGEVRRNEGWQSRIGRDCTRGLPIGPKMKHTATLVWEAKSAAPISCYGWFEGTAV
jgi:hypothetical protein